MTLADFWRFLSKKKNNNNNNSCLFGTDNRTESSGDKEAKYDSEGQKSKNLLKMADFGHFFSLGESGGGDQNLCWGDAPCPCLDAHHWQKGGK